MFASLLHNKIILSENDIFDTMSSLMNTDNFIILQKRRSSFMFDPKAATYYVLRSNVCVAYCQFHKLSKLIISV